MKLIVKLFFPAFTLIAFSTNSMGQAANFKAMFLYNFAKNTLWPQSTKYDNNTFVITIIGDNEIGAALSKLLSSRKLGDKPIVVKQASTIGQLSDSQIIYLGESKSDQIQRLVESQKDNHVLIVAGKSGWCQHGAGISFVNNGGALSYEVSELNIKKFGLTCQNQILRSGTNVD